MNREIKFRTWDSVDKRMSYLGELLLGYGLPKFKLTTDSFAMDELRKEIKERFILQQYTGLNDIDGNEIYEGDIIEIEVHGNILIYDSDGKHYAVVVWNEKKARWWLDIITKTGRHNPSLEIERNRIFRVLGNVFENPELIT